MTRVWLVAAVLSSAAWIDQPRLQAQQTAAEESSGRAEPTVTKTERLRDEQRAYMGRNVRVHLTDGSTKTGRLIGETAEGLAVQPSPSDEPILIPYAQVDSIAAGMRRWQKIAIAGAAAGALVLALALD